MQVELGMPHSSIMRHGLMPVPRELRRLSANLSALEPHLIAMASSRKLYAPVLTNDAFEAKVPQRATSAWKPCSSTKPRRLWRSNSFIEPSLNAAWVTGLEGSGVTMYPRF